MHWSQKAYDEQKRLHEMWPEDFPAPVLPKPPGPPKPPVTTRMALLHWFVELVDILCSMGLPWTLPIVLIFFATLDMLGYKRD